jgi:hypothetical protein
VQRGVVVVKLEGEKEGRRVEFQGEGLGVKREVEEWAEALRLGERNLRISPVEAYKDLLVVRAFFFATTCFKSAVGILTFFFPAGQLEKMLESGERNGMPVDMDQMDR